MSMVLAPTLEAQIKRLKDSGSYSTDDEVVEEALTLLERKNKRKALIQSILDADAECDRGECDEWTPELMDEIWREADALVDTDFIPDPDVCP